VKQNLKQVSKSSVFLIETFKILKLNNLKDENEMNNLSNNHRSFSDINLIIKHNKSYSSKSNLRASIESNDEYQKNKQNSSNNDKNLNIFDFKKTTQSYNDKLDPTEQSIKYRSIKLKKHHSKNKSLSSLPLNQSQNDTSLSIKNSSLKKNNSISNDYSFQATKLNFNLLKKSETILEKPQLPIINDRNHKAYAKPSWLANHLRKAIAGISNTNQIQNECISNKKLTETDNKNKKGSQILISSRKSFRSESQLINPCDVDENKLKYDLRKSNNQINVLNESFKNRLTKWLTFHLI
jgi:hypothetical protein